MMIPGRGWVWEFKAFAIWSGVQKIEILNKEFSKQNRI